MTELRYSLCPSCDACPEVVVTEDAVTIGEADNQVRLSVEEWNVLVEGVWSGRLAPVAAGQASGDSCDCGCDCC